jgi:hypothetical protein
LAKILEKSLLPANERYMKSVASVLNPANPLSYDAKSEKLKEAMSDPEKMKAYAALRTELVNLKVNANTIGLEFFEKRELRPDEVPAYEIEDEVDPIPITVVSTLGGSATTIYSDSRQLATFPLGFLESDWVRANRFDLIQGIVDRSDRINQKISESLDDQMDDMAWIAINACFGLFGPTTWILDPKIKNAPTTNDIDLSNTCQGRVTKDLFKGISEHFDRMGKPVRAVYLPAARRHDLFDWVSVTDGINQATDTVPTSVTEEIWRKGTAGGALIPPIRFTNVLEGEVADSIYAYAVTDEAPGYFFQKPFLHMTDEKTEGYWYKAKTTITASFVIPPYRMQNVARFKIG